MDRFLISVLQWGDRLLGVEGGTGCLVSCSLKDFSPDSTWEEVLFDRQHLMQDCLPFEGTICR